MDIRLEQEFEDPEKILQETIDDLREELVQLCQVASQSIAAKEHLEELYSQAKTQSSEWFQRAQLALRNENENMARKAFSHEQKFSETANKLKVELDEATNQVKTVKRNITALESKIAEIQTKQEMLKVYDRASKISEPNKKAGSKVDTSGTIGAFERMQEKVTEIEAQSKTVAKLAGDTLEIRFAELEACSDVAAEIAMLKAQLAEPPAAPEALPNAETVDTPQQETPVDAELEELRKKLDQI